ncbi:MAG: hypothetical protein SH847_02605, partial [Roseiflexaceae bacterium]|nr:hypothetical protein [Roseiflexaceae bacterium]
MLQRPIMAVGAVREPPSMTGNGAQGRRWAHTRFAPTRWLGMVGGGRTRGSPLRDGWAWWFIAEESV